VNRRKIEENAPTEKLKMRKESFNLVIKDFHEIGWSLNIPDFTFFLSSEFSAIRYDSPFSDASTCIKQFVVCPMPLGRIRSRNMEFMTVLFPLLVLCIIIKKLKFTKWKYIKYNWDKELPSEKCDFHMVTSKDFSDSFNFFSVTNNYLLFFLFD